MTDYESIGGTMTIKEVEPKDQYVSKLEEQLYEMRVNCQRFRENVDSISETASSLSRLVDKQAIKIAKLLQERDEARHTLAEIISKAG